MSRQEDHQCRQQKIKNLGPESQVEACIPLSSKKQFARISASGQNTSGFWCWFVKMYCGAFRNISNMEQACCQNQWISPDHPMKYAHCKLSFTVLPAEGYLHSLYVVWIMYPSQCLKKYQA